MIYFVLPLLWICPKPRIPLIGGAIAETIEKTPVPARQLLCQAITDTPEGFPTLAAAQARVAALGPGTGLSACDGTSCRSLPVTWKSIPSFPEASK